MVVVRNMDLNFGLLNNMREHINTDTDYANRGQLKPQHPDRNNGQKEIEPKHKSMYHYVT